jgi:fumarate reductase flavoprotein subunit
MKTQKSIKSKKAGDLVVDVVVIGGGAGLAGALSAAENGMNVVVLEKLKKTGGNAALAVGFLAAESPVQKRLKIEATREDLFKASMESTRWTTNPRIVKAFIDKSGDTVQWLEEMGVTFSDIPFCYHNQFPRIYHVVSGHGSRLIKIMQKKCEDLGVKILCETAANRVLIGDNGEVVGVTAKHKGKDITIRSKAAIIATGGYSGNRELIKKHFPHYTDKLHLYGKPCRGDGLRMALEAGAATEGLGTLLTMGPLFEGSRYVHIVSMESNTIWVNKKGERFINEDVIPSESSNALNRQPDKISFTLFDNIIMQGFIEEGISKAVEPARYPATTKMKDLKSRLNKEKSKGTVKISRSWKAIAHWIGADFSTLKRTIENYNSYCHQGLDDDFFKKRNYLQPLKTPPFFALRCCQAFHGTIGGIKINQHMQVINTSDKVIPGLYASGNDTGGWIAETYPYHLTGTALSFALNSARIAGENMARYVAK